MQLKENNIKLYPHDYVLDFELHNPFKNYKDLKGLNPTQDLKSYISK
jgi:hypothetical protein